MDTATVVLEVRGPAVGTTRVPMYTDRIRLGRAGENDIRFQETHVSRFHAEIKRSGDGFTVVDLGSVCGVYVNGVRVLDHRLADGDVITLTPDASTEVVFNPGAPPDVQPALPMDSVFGLPGRDPGLAKLSRFLEFGRMLGAGLPLDRILESVVDLAVELTVAERGFLILRNPDGSLDGRVGRAREGRSISVADSPVSRTIVRDVLATGNPRFVPRVDEEMNLAEVASVLNLGIRSAIAVPLWHFGMQETEACDQTFSGEPFGVLYLDSSEGRGAFSRLDRDLLANLARDASTAIENARLFREAQQKRKMEEELDKAREVQATLLPRGFQQEAHCEVAGTCLPCLQLGGDYMDQFRFVDGTPCFVVADVSGKGISAALMAAALQGIMASETTASPAPDLGTMIGRVNRALGRRLPEDRFATFFCCVISPQGALSYVNAGHNPPLLVRRHGDAEELSGGGMALGLRAESVYRVQERHLEPGDLVAMYTDGVTEAVRADGESYGESRLADVLRASLDLPMDAILKAVRRDLEEFAGSEPPRDDVTLLLLRHRDPAAGARR